MRDQLLSRDDPRTRSGAAGFPLGSTGRNGRERCEDGADDHAGHKLGICARTEAQSPAAKPYGAAKF